MPPRLEEVADMFPGGDYRYRDAVHFYRIRIGNDEIIFYAKKSMYGNWKHTALKETEFMTGYTRTRRMSFKEAINYVRDRYPADGLDGATNDEQTGIS